MWMKNAWSKMNKQCKWYSFTKYIGTMRYTLFFFKEATKRYT